MKDFIISVAAMIPIIVFEIIVAIIYTGFVDSLLAKNRAWIRFFAIWAGLLLFQTGIYTWLPGKLGLTISFMDGEVEFVDGALTGNLARIMFMHSLSIVLSALSHIWKAIRKKAKFNWRFVLVELAVVAVLIFAGVKVLDRAKTETGPAEQSRITAMIIIGLLLILWGYRSIKKKYRQVSKEVTFEVGKKSGQKDGTPGRRPVSAASQPGPPMEKFERVVAEKDRLKAMGDYASQIPLLTKATELDVDDQRKARIWNYLGMAHEQLNSPKRAEECYRSALLLDKDNPSAHNNLALICSDRGDYVTALRHMEAAIKEAKARGQALGIYYGNYALITGKAGNMSQADDYLTLAKNAGYDDASIRTVRRKLGMKGQEEGK